MLFRIIAILAMAFAINASAQTVNNVAGQYNALLFHNESNFFQYAKVTLRTVNPAGNLKISANLRVFFGDYNSNEYLTYDFDDVPLNLLTRQISLESEDNDVSMIGYLKDGKLGGEWFSSLIGFVGRFEAQKLKFPEIPEGATLVKALSGHYRGTITNENPESSLPERVSLSFVTTQENVSGNPALLVTGNSRFYLGEFGSQEYVELAFKDIQFNFYNRFLTAKTSKYGLTFKGYLQHNGIFEGVIYSDAVGKVGPAKLTKHEIDSPSGDL